MSCRFSGMESYPISSSIQSSSNGYDQCISQHRHNNSNDITLRSSSDEIINASSSSERMMNRTCCITTRNNVNINTANEGSLRCVAGSSHASCSPESSRLDPNCNNLAPTNSRQCLNSRGRTSEDRVRNEEHRGDVDGNSYNTPGNIGGRQRRR